MFVRLPECATLVAERDFAVVVGAAVVVVVAVDAAATVLDIAKSVALLST